MACVSVLALIVGVAASGPYTQIEVAAFVYDPWTPDPAVWGVHGENWTEWELVRRAESRFPGHLQPHVPLWGELDTQLPETWSLLNAAALHAGISVYLWDWYWWTGCKGPLLARGLERGFLHSNNSNSMKWAVMWANQDWFDIFPSKYGVDLPPMFKGQIDRSTFDQIVAYWITNYFHLSNYYRAPDASGARVCPMINIYELDVLVDGLGGVPATVDAFNAMRASAKAAGYPCVHVQAEGAGVRSFGSNLHTVLAQLAVNSITDYCWQHYQGMPSFPLTPYAPFANQSIAAYDSNAKQVAPVPYIPNFSVGWDPSPRTVQSDSFRAGSYPWTPVIQATPTEIQTALSVAADYIWTNCDHSWCMMTVYAYTEFSEGGTLWPTVADGYGRLDAFQAVFGSRLAGNSTDHDLLKWRREASR